MTYLFEEVDVGNPVVRVNSFLGETVSRAYRGDRGKIAYDHSQSLGNPHGLAWGDISGYLPVGQLPTQVARRDQANAFIYNQSVYADIYGYKLILENVRDYGTVLNPAETMLRFKNTSYHTANIIAKCYATNVVHSDLFIGAAADVTIDSKTAHLVIKGDTGNIGIGTETPGKKLEITDATDYAAKLRLRGSSSLFWDIGTDYENVAGQLAFKNALNVMVANLNQDGAFVANDGVYFDTAYSAGMRLYGSDGIRFRTGGVDDKLRLYANGGLGLKDNIWHTSLDGKDRLFFTTNSTNFYKTAGTGRHIFRNSSDHEILQITNEKTVIIAGDDSVNLLRMAGLTAGMRMTSVGGTFYMEATNQTYSAYLPLNLTGTAITLNAPTYVLGALEVHGASGLRTVNHAGDLTGIFAGFTAVNRPVVRFQVSDASPRFKLEVNDINTGTERLGVFAGTTEYLSVNALGYTHADGLRLKGTDTRNTIWNANNDIGITANIGCQIRIGQTYFGTDVGLSVNTTNGNIHGSANVQLDNNNSGFFANGAVAGFYVATNSIRFRSNSIDNRMVLQETGNLTIGTAVDYGYRLNVVGDTKLTGSTLSTGSIYAGDGVSVGSIVLTPGTASVSGYLQWLLPSGARIAYMGYNSGSDVTFNNELGGSLQTNCPIDSGGYITSTVQSLAADPTGSDLASGKTRTIKNTSTGTTKVWLNDGGTFKSLTFV